MAICGVLWKVWKFIRHLIDSTWRRVRPCEELTFLGVTREGEIIPPALLGLHRIIWKMVIISLTQAEFERKPVSPNSILSMSVRRFVVRVRALHASYLLRSRHALIRNLPAPKPASVNRWLTPLAEVGTGGDLVWHTAWCRRAEQHGVDLRDREPGGLPDQVRGAPPADRQGMKRVNFVRAQRAQEQRQQN